MRTERRDRSVAVEVALAVLVRLVVDDGWSESAAARQLREQVADDSVLRRVRARVARVLAERDGPFGQRAVATLDAALALGPLTSLDAGSARRPACAEGSSPW